MSIAMSISLNCSATFPSSGWNKRPRSTGRNKGRQDKPVIRPPDFTKPSPAGSSPAKAARPPLQPNETRPLGFWEITPQFPGASFPPQDSSLLNILAHRSLSYQREASASSRRFLTFFNSRSTGAAILAHSLRLRGGESRKVCGGRARLGDLSISLLPSAPAPHEWG